MVDPTFLAPFPLTAVRMDSRLPMKENPGLRIPPPYSHPGTCMAKAIFMGEGM